MVVRLFYLTKCGMGYNHILQYGVYVFRVCMLITY